MEAKVSAPTQLDEWAEPTLTGSSLYASAQDTVTISSALNNTTLSSPYTVTGAIGTRFPNSIWTASTTATTAPWISSNPTGLAPKITLNGEGADVEVNGWSLVAAVKRIEERLGLYQPNPELEAEWEDLRALADEYRKLEQYIREKQATFERLRAMPVPDIE